MPGFRVFGMRGWGLVWVIENNPNHQMTGCRVDFERGCAAWFCSCWFPTWFWS